MAVTFIKVTEEEQIEKIAEIAAPIWHETYDCINDSTNLSSDKILTTGRRGIRAVSYTHLDVYKRQHK